MAKILIIRLTSLGDVIFTLPLVNTLAAEHEVSYLTAEKGLGAIKDNPSIKNVYFAPLKKWRKNPFSISRYVEFFKLIKEIRKEKFDIALDCQQMFKSLFLMLLCGAKRRITFSDARELSVFAGNEFVRPKAKFRDFNYHIVERNLDFAGYLNVEPREIKFTLPCASQEIINQCELLLKDIDASKKNVVISPETTWKNKHWDIENWKKLVFELNGKCNLIYTGLDNSLHDKIMSEEINHINLTGKTDIEMLKVIFEKADVVISPDSGSANLAWACSKPAVIEIFTCTPAKRFGVYGNSDKYFALQGDAPCQPCFKKKCKKNFECTKTVTSQKVLDILSKLL